MKKARQNGKRIGRPKVTERPDFLERLADMKKRLSLGEISKRRAAKELDIGYATLKRLLDRPSMLPAVINNINSIKTIAEVLY